MEHESCENCRYCEYKPDYVNTIGSNNGEDWYCHYYNNWLHDCYGKCGKWEED